MPTLQVIHQDDDWNNSLEGEDPTHGNANTDASTVLLGSKSVKKQTHYVTIPPDITCLSNQHDQSCRFNPFEGYYSSNGIFAT